MGEHIIEHMDVGCDERTVGWDRAFGGLWWMDGDPSPEHVASFAGANFIENTSACSKPFIGTGWGAGDTYKVPCKGSMILDWSKPKVWAFPDTARGRQFAGMHYQMGGLMKFDCGARITSKKKFEVCEISLMSGLEKATADSGGDLSALRK